MASYLDIIPALLLLFTCAGLSFWKNHQLHKDFIKGALRSILQLLLLGYLLGWIFKNEHVFIILGVGLLMTLNAAIHSKKRVQITYGRLLLDNFLSIALVIWPLTFMGSVLLHSTTVFKVDIFLPLLGMLLGNTLNGIALGIDAFGSELKSKSEEVLSIIALGANPQEATSQIIVNSLRISMTPMLNAMASMGIVSIPGMMTGQLLAGQSPAKAAVVQIIIVLLIAVGTYLGTFFALILSRKKKFLSGEIPCFG